jgi:tetratricopeptide (TPR) repeat protein
MVKRLLLVGGAALCFALAAGLLLLAPDVGRWEDAIAADDIVYRSTPDEPSLWQPREIVPLGLARTLLETDDDVALRRGVRALRLGRLETGATSDPDIYLSRGEARARLQEIAGGNDDAVSRSRALNLLGVYSFSAAINEARGQFSFIQDAVAALQAAIELDPSNVEAKTNLELALQKGRTLEAAEAGGGPNPTPGGAGAKGAGAGDPGSGY